MDQLHQQRRRLNNDRRKEFTTLSIEILIVLKTRKEENVCSLHTASAV